MSNQVTPIAHTHTTSHQLIRRVDPPPTAQLPGSLISPSHNPHLPPAPLYPTTLALLSAPPPLAVDDEPLDPHLASLYHDMRDRLMQLLVLDNNNTATLSRMRREVQDLQGQLAGAEPERQTLQGAIAAHKAAADRWQTLAEEADTARVKAEERVKRVEASLVELRAEMKERLEGDGRLHQQAVIAQDARHAREVTELKAGLSTELTRLHEGRTGLKRDREQLRVEQEQLRKGQRDVEQRGAQSSSNEAAVAALKRSLNACQQRLSQTEKELAVVRGQLEAATGRERERPQQQQQQQQRQQEAAQPNKRPAEPWQRDERSRDSRRHDDGSGDEEYSTCKSSKRR